MPTAGNAETVATAVSVTLLLVVVGAAVAGVLAARAARRRFQRFRGRLAVAPLAAGARGVDYVLRSPAASPGWWAMQADRRRLSRAVSAAQHAVATAQAAGAPVGDLPALTRRLHRAAQAVDRALVASGGSRTQSAEVRQRQREVRDSADRIHAAAMDSLTATAREHTSELTRSVQIEAEALRAGLQSSRVAGTGWHP